MSTHCYKIGILLLLFSLCSCSSLLDTVDGQYLVENDFYKYRYKRVNEFEIEENALAKDDYTIDQEYNKNSTYYIGNQQIVIYKDYMKGCSFDEDKWIQCYGEISYSNFAYNEKKNCIYFYNFESLYLINNKKLELVIYDPIKTYQKHEEKTKIFGMYFENDFLHLYEGNLTNNRIEYVKMQLENETYTLIENNTYALKETKQISNMRAFANIGTIGHQVHNEDCTLYLSNGKYLINEESKTIEKSDTFSIDKDTFISKISEDEYKIEEGNKRAVLDLAIEKTNKNIADISHRFNIFSSKNKIYLCDTLYVQTKKYVGNVCYNLCYIFVIDRESFEISYMRPDSLSHYSNLFVNESGYFIEIKGSNILNCLTDIDNDFVSHNIYRIKL